MKEKFLPLKSTENQTVYIRKEAIGGFEVVPGTQHVEGHIKLFVSGYKFLVQADKDELLKQLNED